MLKANDSFLIGQRWIGSEQLAHDAPEHVTPMRVILTGFQ
jgi:hypothetical protein